MAKNMWSNCSRTTAKNSIKKCTCRHGHVQLQGYDKEAHAKRTAAALFSKRFCNALCKDMMSIQPSKEQHTTYYFIGDDTANNCLEPPPGLPTLNFTNNQNNYYGNDDPDVPRDEQIPHPVALPKSPLEHLQSLNTNAIKLTVEIGSSSTRSTRS